jgi:MFS family permease
MRKFTIIWSGQLVSMIGSAMTWFALTIWAWEETGKASALSTIAFFAFLPSVLLSPIAGALVDRWNRLHDRRLVLALSDFATALGTLVILLIFTLGDLQIWHIYLVSILAGFFTAFQYPAFIAAVTSLIEKKDYARAEGMLGSARALSGILAPIFAASLLGFVGMRGIMLIDLATFLAALATLWMVRIPPPEHTQVGLRSRGTLAQEIRFGFTYIREDRMLSSLTALFMITGVFLAIGATLIAPLVLGGTGNNESALASVQATGAVGGVVGGALLSVWGGAKRRIHNVLIGGAGACLLGIVWLGAGTGVLLWALGGFFFAFFEPFVEGGNLAIWQERVPPDVQGRVLSARHLLVQLPYLVGILLAGYLAEAVTVPQILIFAGLAGTICFASGYLFQSIQEVNSG